MGGGDTIEDADGENYINGLTAWIESDVIATDKGFVTGKPPSDGDKDFSIRYDNAGKDGGGDDVIKAGVTVGTAKNLESSALAQTTNWQHVAVTWASGGQLTLYLDGSLDTPTANSPAFSGSVSAMTTFLMGVGPKDSATAGWDGIIDEVRISDIARSADWIDAQHDNQNDPGDIGTSGRFYDVGSEESSPTFFADVTTFEATAAPPEGVLLEWRTGFEVDDLGFHVYRQEDGQKIRITPELVAGSALFAGLHTPLTAGRSYAWPDPEGRSGDRYWLEDVDLDGERTWHGPITATPDGAVEKDSAASWSLLLSQLGRDGPQKRMLVSSGPTRPGQPQVSEATLEERRQRQWESASQPAVKLEITEEGWYRVRQPELVAAGLAPGVNPRFLQLIVEGEEQPLVVQGASDESFDAGDAIQFYGSGADTPWTDTRTYWLVEGGEPGQRVPVLSPPLAAAAEPESFSFTVEQKERTIYVAAVKNGEVENFFGPVVTSTPVEQALSVHRVDGTQAEAQLEISLQGLGQQPHQVKILFNAMEVGSTSFFGSERRSASFTVPASWLQDGENVVTLMAEGGETDVGLVDVIGLTYWHTYRADDDALEFTVSGLEGAGQRVTVGGFSSPQIAVIDVTDPKETKELARVVQAQGAGYAIRVGVPGSGLRTLLAVAGAQTKQPTAIQANQPSAWHEADSGAQVVIIAHRDFLASLEPLKALREAQGYSVAVVDVEDVYDEFAFGAKTPWALRDFLVWASQQWQTSPRFVLLVGDASFDARNYLAFGEGDWVPTRLVETTFLETASDDWFVDFDSDGVPELAVGRLPVSTAVEADTVVAKIVAYEEEPEAAWRQEVLLVADEPDSFTDFEQASSELKALLSAELTVGEIYRGQSGATAKTELLAKLNQGQLLVNYLGHGSVEVWNGDLFTSDDARALTNGSRLPFFVNLTCLNGLFHDLFTESLAETLLKADEGGAVAVWASSALTTPEGQLQANRELFRLLSQQEGPSLGEAMARAKAAVSDPDVRRSLIFFGDPLTTIRVPGGQGDEVSFPNSKNQETIRLVSEGGTTFVRAAAVENPSPEKVPSQPNFPVGFFDFTLQGTPVGQATTVTIFLADGVMVNTYWKFGPTPDNPIPHWYEFLFDGVTGAEILSDRIILHFVDGERGDDDLTANGAISSQGGLAFSTPAVAPAVLQMSSSLSAGVTAAETFVGMAIVNPNDYPNPVSLSVVDSSGIEVDRIVLAEIPAKGQNAFLTHEVLSYPWGEVMLIARGQEGPIQSFFLMGDYAFSRLDGVAGDFQCSRQVYFPVVQQVDNGDTLLFVFNPAMETATATFRLFDQDGALLQEAARAIAGEGFVAETVQDLLGTAAGGESYLQVEANVPLMSFAFLPGAEAFSALRAQVPQSTTRLLAPHFFVDDQGGTTEIRLLSTDNNPVAVKIKAFDDASTLLAESEFELAAQTLFVGQVGELLNLDPAGQEWGVISGYLELELGGISNLVGAVTFTSRQGGSRATLPLSQGGRTRTSFLQVAQSQEAGMFTGLAILNGGSEAATVTLRAFDLDGNQSAEVEFTLAAGTRRVATLNEESFFGQGFQQIKGHFEVISSAPVVTFALFGDFGLHFLSAIEGQAGVAGATL